MSRTKIIATIGPATNTPRSLKELAEAGMAVARLNGSHSDLEWHSKTIATIRETLPDIPILLDIPGRKIRTATLSHEPSFLAGEILTLTTDPSHDCEDKVLIGSPTLHEDVTGGSTILADDGTLRFTVVNVEGRDIHCRAEIAGTLRSRKGINVPSVALRGELITKFDREIIGFARDHSVDFIGISFVQSADHVRAIREVVGGDSPRIVSKVESQEGLDHLEEIVVASDVIMIDRGDLSVETNLENVVLMQKRIISVAQAHARPVIVATEMLHSMIDKPFPTKAEISDISNAVLDGAAATMLSGETAIGTYPVEAVSIMHRVAAAADTLLQDTLDGYATGSADVPQAMAEAIAQVCRSLPVTKIVAVTISGFAARTIAARQPRQPIIAVSNDAKAARAFNLLAGTTGFHVEIPFSKDSTDHIPACLEKLWRAQLLVDEDLVLVTSVAYPRSGNRMNMLQTHRIADLKSSLAWS